jgi:CheY-like chemotaxis protein
MARAKRVVLLHWNVTEAQPRLRRLRDAGFTPLHAPLSGPDGIEMLRKNPPDAIVIDLTRLPSHGREVAIHLRLRKETRQVPLVFVEGETEKVARIKALLPDATFTHWDRIGDALAAAMKNAPANPVVPKDAMAGYSGTPLPKKLGIKSGSTVALVNAPDDFGTRTLGEALPENVRFINGTPAARDLTIWFVRSAKELKSGTKRAVAAARHGPVWIAWPKKTSALASDIGEQLVRETGLSAGLVDYKICAIDQTWSGLLFCTRKPDARK